MGKEKGAFLDSLLIQRQELNLLKPAGLVGFFKTNTVKNLETLPKD